MSTGDDHEESGRRSAPIVPVAKRTYQPPRLRDLGTVAQLTTAGVSGNQEGQAMTSMRRMA